MIGEADTFHTNGFLVVDNVIDQNIVEASYNVAMDSFRNAQQIILDKGLHFGIGIKHGFKEIVQRHSMRYEMPYGMESQNYDFILRNERLMKLVAEILQCEDFIVANRSLVISLPGCNEQGWHSDGPHVSVDQHLPCHVLNIFVPLVDVDLTNGPTEFRPGSHHYTRGNLAKSFLLAVVKKRIRSPECPTIKRGSALLFDYRVLHRGTANKSSEPRPILVFTFAKPWYKDMLNFPHRSLHDEAALSPLPGSTEVNFETSEVLSEQKTVGGSSLGHSEQKRVDDFCPGHSELRADHSREQETS